MAVDDRARYIAGLRELADMLEANPDVQLPYGTGTGTHPATRVSWFFHCLSDVRAFVDAFPSALARDEAESSAGSGFPHVFFGDLAGLRVSVYCASVLDEDEVRAVSGSRACVDAAGRA